MTTLAAVLAIWCGLSLITAGVWSIWATAIKGGHPPD